MECAKNDREYPCTCGKDMGKGYYEFGCIIHDELAYRRHVLKLLANLSPQISPGEIAEDHLGPYIDVHKDFIMRLPSGTVWRKAGSDEPSPDPSLRPGGEPRGASDAAEDTPFVKVPPSYVKQDNIGPYLEVATDDGDAYIIRLIKANEREEP